MRFISSFTYFFLIGASVGAIFVSAFPAYASTNYCRGECVKVAGLNVRTGPGTNYPRVGIIHKNEIYISGQHSGEWSQIWYDNHKRWIHRGYTSWSYYKCVKVTASALNVRTGPDILHRKVGVAMRNSNWVFNGCNNSRCKWTKIWYRSEPRWVYSKYLYDGKSAKALSSVLKPEIELSNVNINNSADRTNSRYVTVHFDSTTTPEYYRISDDPAFPGADWIKAKGSKIDYTLSDKAGNNTIYLQLMNENGRLSNVDSDNIYHLLN